MRGFKRMLRACAHPADEFTEMKWAHDWPVAPAWLTLLCWFLVTVLAAWGTNFKFNYNHLSELNILNMFVSTVVLFLVFTVINWALTTLLDGKGTVREIFVSCAWALAPMVIAQAVCVLLGYGLTRDEGMFLTVIEAAGLIWSGYLLISAQRTVHDYSVPKTLVCLALTALGIVFVLFLMVLFFGLLQQFVLFFQTIYVELNLRR